MTELLAPPVGRCLVCGGGTDDEDTDLCEECLTPAALALLEALRAGWGA
jgi:hypothetical protein